MRLRKFSCYLNKEAGYKDEWAIHDIYLNDLNLLVGKNSTGKSRALRAVKLFAKAVTSGNLVRAHFVFDFEADDYPLVYEIKCEAGLNITELITINQNQIVLDRKGNEAKIYSFVENRIQTIHPPEGKLTLNTRRDTSEYPFFEEIVFWAESVQSFNFGHVHASLTFDSDSLEREKTISSDKTIGEMVDILTVENKVSVIRAFNELGYLIEDVTPNYNKSKKEIIIKESYLTQGILEGSISQGMFRALSLLIFIHFMFQEGKLKTIVIDDLCEGLDYERSQKLGRKIFDVLKQFDVQAITTTNDYFLMNSIDIDYWNILRREKGVVYSYNKAVNPNLFEKFDFSGLMNFDFFSSDFIEKEQGNG